MDFHLITVFALFICVVEACTLTRNDSRLFIFMLEAFFVHDGSCFPFFFLIFSYLFQTQVDHALSCSFQILQTFMSVLGLIYEYIDVMVAITDPTTTKIYINTQSPSAC